MSEHKTKAVLAEDLVAQRIKVGDTINGHTVTEKVWTRDIQGNCTVHVVYVDGDKEQVSKLDPNLTFTTIAGHVSSDEVFAGKRVRTHFSGDSTGWVVTESHSELVDITNLKS